jgi:putative ABC transport system permease protein
MLFQDIQYGLRGLARRPGFSAVALLTLALGTGATTSIFTIVNGVLLRPLPYPESSHLVKVYGGARDTDRLSNLSPPDVADLASGARTLEAMAAMGSVGSFTLTGTGTPERLTRVNVGAAFFGVLRVRPALGRDFRPDEDRAGGPDVAIVTDGFWKSRLGARADVIGSAIEVDARKTTIIGVLPRGYRHPEPGGETRVGEPELYRLLQLDPAVTSRSGRFVRAIARLRPGTSLDQAAAELTALARGLELQYPATNSERTVRVMPLHGAIVGNARTSLLVL